MGCAAKSRVARQIACNEAVMNNHVTRTAIALALPFAGSLVKKQLVQAEETQFYRCDATANKGKRWKPHKSMKKTWPIIYAAMGLASWLVWREGGLRSQSTALGRYFCLLLANVLCWPPIFFGGHSRRFAVLDCGVLLLATLLTIPKFYEANSAAGMLLLPYLGWTCFASTLINCSFWSSDPAVISKAQRMSAVQQSTKLEVTPPGAHVESSGSAHPVKQPSFLKVDVPKRSTNDASTSPFSGAAQVSSPTPLTQARDLLSKMTDSLTTDDSGATSNELLRTGLLRVNSLLNKVNNTIQGAAEAIAEGPGPLTRVGSLLTRVSMSLQRGQSGDEEILKWPSSDSIPVSYFSCPGPAGYKVRGPTYLRDKKKIVPDSCTGRLVSLNLVSVKEPIPHIARFLPSIRDSKAPFIFVWQVMVPGRTHLSLVVAWALDHDPAAAINAAANSIPEDETVDLHRGEPLVGEVASSSGQSTPQPRLSPGVRDMPDTLPRPHDESQKFSVEQSSKSTSALQANQHRPHRHRRTASTIGADPPTPLAKAAGSGAELGEQALSSPIPAPKGAKPFDVAMARFLDESGTPAEVTARRHSMFKIIPRVEEGGWVVKKAVGQNTPVLLGKKLTTKYHRGPNYLEADVDVGSSRSAASVVGLVQGALKTLVIDIAVLLEGKTQEELPESLLGTVRLEHLDLSKAAFLDVATGNIEKKE